MNLENKSATRYARRLVHASLWLAGALALGCDLNERSADPEVDAGPVANPERYAQGADGSVPADENCPYPQWDCTQLPPACERDVSQGAALGCFCNRLRPLSHSDCAYEERFFCLAGAGGSDPPTWYNRAHIQCSCVPDPPAAWIDTCLQLFQQTAATMDVDVPPHGCGRNACTPDWDAACVCK